MKMTSQRQQELRSGKNQGGLWLRRYFRRNKGIIPPGWSDPEVEGHWKLDRIPHDVDRQGFRGWDAADVVITLLEPTDAKFPFSLPSCCLSGVVPSSEKGLLWLAVRALGLCVQPAHK